jgi:2-hydroxychromene-2-carboxylate isomerase
MPSARRLAEGKHIMALSFEFYWSFRSPYSYIALPRVMTLTRDSAVEVDLRIVHPAAIRNPAYFRAMNPLSRPYFLLDGARQAAFHGLPFRRPVPDPIVQDQQTLAIAEHQPYIYRLSRLGIAAVRHGRGLAFCDEVSRLLWDGSVDNWHEGSHLAQAADRAGLDLAELDREIEADPERHEAALAANDQALRAAGHWGVPTAVFQQEPFFGQDRLDTLIWRLRQHGLTPRDREAELA